MLSAELAQGEGHDVAHEGDDEHQLEDPNVKGDGTERFQRYHNDTKFSLCHPFEQIKALKKRLLNFYNFF